MRPIRLMTVIYWVLLVLIVAQSSWWVYYLSREGDRYLAFQSKRMQSDLLHARYLIEIVPEIAADPQTNLAAAFPHLAFHVRGDGEVMVHLREQAWNHHLREADRRRNMFLGEGIFFIALLLAGSVLLTLAYRREQSYRHSRELLLAGVTHEFKTPLASLQLFAETMERSDLDEPGRSDLLVHMKEDITRLDDMVSQILAVSRAEGGHRLLKRSLDLAEETERVLSVQDAFLRSRNAEVESSLDSDCQIIGDSDALRMAIGNILRNALLYTEGKPAIEIEVKREGDSCVLRISDQGIGIPPAEQKRIFQRFYRVGEAAGRPRGVHGSGLGLFLVKRSVEQMGGEVSVESKEGAGSTFSLIFPAAGERS